MGPAPRRRRGERCRSRRTSRGRRVAATAAMPGVRVRSPRRAPGRRRRGRRAPREGPRRARRSRSNRRRPPPTSSASGGTGGRREFGPPEAIGASVPKPPGEAVGPAFEAKLRPLHAARRRPDPLRGDRADRRADPRPRRASRRRVLRRRRGARRQRRPARRRSASGSRPTAPARRASRRTRRRATPRGAARRRTARPAILGLDAPALRRACPTAAFRSRAEELRRALAAAARGLPAGPRPLSVSRRDPSRPPGARARRSTSVVAASRPEDAGPRPVSLPAHRVLRALASAPAERARRHLGRRRSARTQALAAFASQQAVRDYAGAIRGLNAYRRLTLPGRGPGRGVPRRDLRRGLDDARSRSCAARSGPRVFADESARPGAGLGRRPHAQPAGAPARGAREPRGPRRARPRQVVVVNDGGASPREVTEAFRDAFDVVLEDSEAAARPLGRRQSRRRARAGRSSSPSSTTTTSASRTTSSGSSRAHRQGPEPVVYSDAVTVVYGQGDGGLGAARADAPVLARLRSRLPAARQLHPDPHAAPAARALSARSAASTRASSTRRTGTS